MKKKLFLFFEIIFTYLMMMNILEIKNYNSFSLLLLILISFLYYEIDYKNKSKMKKEEKKNYLIFSFLISFSQILGMYVYRYQFSRTVSVIREFIGLTSLIDIIGMFILIYTLLTNFVPKILKLKILSEKQKYSNTKIYLICFFTILICWLPYFLVLYPAVLTSDSTDQFSRVVNGFKIVSDHHPVIHTLFIGIVYKIGFFIFKNENIATSFVAFTQMCIMSGIFSYLITFLYRKKVSIKILLLILLYFALSPIHGYYSVTMWKDILFSGIALLFVLNLIIMDEYKKISIYRLSIFIILSLLFLLFRNNALYVYILMIPIMLFLYKNNIIKIIICIIISLSCYFIIKIPIFNHYNIIKSSSSEYIAIPLQQIGRMAYKFVDFTDYEKDMINSIIPIETMSTVYSPMTVDNIKFNLAYKRDVFDSNKSEYFKLWLNLVIKHPSIAVESYLNNTLGYWYSNVEFWATGDSIFENDMNIYSSPKGGQLLNKIVRKTTSRDIPLFSLQWSTGLCFIFVFSSAFLLIIERKKRDILYYAPIFGVWITMMLATPVFAEFRYIYCAYTCLPLLMLLPFINIEYKSK